MKKDTRLTHFLQLLECPRCHHELKFYRSMFVCRKCRGKYPYKNEIPIMTVDDQTTSHIQKQAVIYDREYSKKSYGYQLENWQKSYIERTAELFNISARSSRQRTYLDVGAGPGHTVIEFARRGILSVGCDISYGGARQAMRMAARQKVSENFLYVVCDAANLPFKKGVFDYVSCIMLLEHLENDDEVVSEMTRILRRTGKIYVAVPNTYWHFWLFMWPINYWHDRRLAHLRHYSARHLARMFSRVGLTKSKIFYSAHMIKFVQLYYRLLPQQLQDRVWWRLERIDESQHSARTGLHLNGVFSR